MITSSKFEHTSAVFHLDEKNFAVSGDDTLRGLTQESARLLGELGDKGWELVSVVPYSRSVFLPGSTNAMLGFFRRVGAARA